MGKIAHNMQKLADWNSHHWDKINALQREQEIQKAFHNQVTEKMQELEYANKGEEGLDLDLSYHLLPIASEMPLVVFGEPLPVTCTHFLHPMFLLFLHSPPSPYIHQVSLCICTISPSLLPVSPLFLPALPICLHFPLLISLSIMHDHTCLIWKGSVSYNQYSLDLGSWFCLDSHSCAGLHAHIYSLY